MGVKLTHISLKCAYVGLNWLKWHYNLFLWHLNIVLLYQNRLNVVILDQYGLTSAQNLLNCV